MNLFAPYPDLLSNNFSSIPRVHMWGSYTWEWIYKELDLTSRSYNKKRAPYLKIAPWFIWRGFPGETSDRCTPGDPATWRTPGFDLRESWTADMWLNLIAFHLSGLFTITLHFISPYYTTLIQSVSCVLRNKLFPIDTICTVALPFPPVPITKIHHTIFEGIAVKIPFQISSCQGPATDYNDHTLVTRSFVG